jgi:dihydroorotate dehydrogenase (NAD+) catalytic subunit
MDLRTTLGRLALKNPILVASGTFGYAREAASSDQFDLLGGIIPKTVTVQPRKGCAPPRIVETPAGMLNAIGLDNDGIDYFVCNHLPYLSGLGTAIIVNIAGETADEFARLAERLSVEASVAGLELNLSCPNVAGGIDFATQPGLTERVVAGVRRVFSKPVLAKLTPNVTDIVDVARAAANGGADAVTLINTLVGLAVDWRRRRPILANSFGGLSGPAIKPVALAMVARVTRAVSIPVCAVGGIRTIDDVMEFLVAGAHAVQVGTANFFDPGIATRLVGQLPAAIEAANGHSVGEIVGTIEWP